MAILKQAELRIPVAELNRHVGVSERRFYRWKKWKKKYTGLKVERVWEVKQMAEEHPIEADCG